MAQMPPQSAPSLARMHVPHRAPSRRRILRLAAMLALGVALALPAAAQQRQRPQPAPSPAQPPPAARSIAPANPLIPEVSARQAIVADMSTGAVLFEKNADERMPPSSMSKIMTAYVVFDAIKRGDLRLEDTLPVSERAWRMQGSKMFVPLGERVKVEDLLRGMIVQSGNDACIVLAEGIAGSEEAFAERMNQVAARLGLNASRFRNSSGWPDPEHVMTARDLLRLSERLVADFPEYYRFYGEREFTFGRDSRGTPITQPNRNPLLYRQVGADGIKTGHTESAGFGLTASAMREGRRIVMVVNGWPTARARAEESERLLEWAFREFGTYTLFKAGQPIEPAQVWLGKTQTVQMVAARDVVVTIPRRLRPQLAVRIAYDTPVAAPVLRGQTMGTLSVVVPERPAMTFPLVAEGDVERLGYTGRVFATLGHLAFGRR
jgi:D-alanyl-D-alanine carboxypeptidase (penicillin-binding protein 5/6)